jgi:hypothetical protein
MEFEHWSIGVVERWSDESATLCFREQEVVPQMIRYLDQRAKVAERSYDLLVISLSRNGEITDHDWDMLTEKKKPVDEVRDFTLLREVQKELKLR